MRKKPAIEGVSLDEKTRCAHWHGPNDIIAIRFSCCDRWFACVECHSSLTTHPSRVWARTEYENAAVFCGECQTTLTIADYLKSENACPNCTAKFNPRCSLHHHLYFDEKST